VVTVGINRPVRVDNVGRFGFENPGKLRVAGRVDLRAAVLLDLRHRPWRLGLAAGFISPDETTLRYVKERTSKGFEIIETDSDYDYAEIYEVDVSNLEPLVACPHNPDNVKQVSIVEGTKIDSAGIGTCTGARLEDLRVVAKILSGKKVHPDVRMHIVPGTREIYAKALREGLIDIFIEAKAFIGVPSCFGCGTIYRAPGYTSISTGPRNFRGRRGAEDSLSYLASPATVTASAIEGKIVDPRRY